MRTFSEFLNTLVGKMGQGTLADSIRIDGATLSRFRSGQGSINIDFIDRIFEVGEARIIDRAEYRRFEDALETITKLWSEERHKNAVINGTRK